MTDPLLISMLSHAADERRHGRWDVASALTKGADEIERLRKLLEPCRPDTDAQTDPSYPKTVDDVLSLLSAYIADFLPEDVCPDDEYFGAWERQARKVVGPIMQERDEARATANIHVERALIDSLESDLRETRAELSRRWTPVQKEIALAALEKATFSSREEIVANPLGVAKQHSDYVFGIERLVVVLKQQLAEARAALREAVERCARSGELASDECFTRVSIPNEWIKRAAAAGGE